MTFIAENLSCRACLVVREEAKMSAFYSILFLLLGIHFVVGDFVDYNSNCPDLSNALSKGCTVSSDCTKISCTVSDLGDKILTTTIKINKCDDPVTITVTVDASGMHWSKTFKSNEKIGVPGLSIKVLGISAGVFVKVSLQDTGSNLQFKVSLMVGIEGVGPSVTLIDSNLPISTYECGIIRWWKNLGTALQALLVVGILVVLIGPCICCCYCCCCRKNTPGTVIVTQPPPATVISTNKTNVPMQPFMNEA